MAKKKTTNTNLSATVRQAQKNYEDAEKTLKNLMKNRTSLLVGATVDDSEVNALAQEVKQLEDLLTSVVNQIQDGINYFNEEVNIKQSQT